MVRYMKKWWLSSSMQLASGEQVMFRGWICTLHDGTPPEFISGDVWGWMDSAGTHGGFRLDSATNYIPDCRPGEEGKHGSFLLGHCYPMPLTSEDFKGANFRREDILDRSFPLDCCWPRFDARIEDMLNISRSYTIAL